jgi:hypothetical protein
MQDPDTCHANHAARNLELHGGAPTSLRLHAEGESLPLERENLLGAE